METFPVTHSPPDPRPQDNTASHNPILTHNCASAGSIILSIIGSAFVSVKVRPYYKNMQVQILGKKISNKRPFLDALRQDRTHTRHGASPKGLFVYPLRADAREVLRGDGGR